MPQPLPIIDAEFTLLDEGRPLDDRASDRALVATDSRRASEPMKGGRRISPQAAFLAQLIAGALQVPQSRLLRRASSADGLASYRASQREQPRADRAGERTSFIA
jgi:hypothetical protein